jgi:restriction system protein
MRGATTRSRESVSSGSHMASATTQLLPAAVGWFMAVPPFHAFLQPLLELVADGREVRFSDAQDLLGERLSVSPEEQAELLPSGKQRRFANRVGWAKTYLTKAGLVETPRRGYMRITPRGQKALLEGAHIDLEYLRQFEDFQAFAGGNNEGGGVEAPTDVGDIRSTLTPDERIDELVRRMNHKLAIELLDQLREKEAAFFEHVVVRLLVKMGYGGSIEDAGKAVGRSGDGGIDGIIKQDRLGLDNVYVQAKRYAAARTVGPGEVRDLAGALQMRKATKGVLITTSSFTKDAIDTARQIGTIVLVDGEQLAQLMIEYDLGVATEATYALKKVDQDFFDEWA